MLRSAVPPKPRHLSGKKKNKDGNQAQKISRSPSCQQNKTTAPVRNVFCSVLVIPVSHPISFVRACSALSVRLRARPHLFPFQSISGSLNCRLRSECRRRRCVLYSSAPTPAVPCLHPLSRWAEVSVCTAAAILRCVGLGCPFGDFHHPRPRPPSPSTSPLSVGVR